MNIFKKVISFILCFVPFYNFNHATYGVEQKANTYMPTIAIDLDGVLDDYSKYEENKIPEIKKGAKEFIKELNKRGYNLILFTNRKPLTASKWLMKNKLDKYFQTLLM